MRGSNEKKGFRVWGLGEEVHLSKVTGFDLVIGFDTKDISHGVQKALKHKPYTPNPIPHPPSSHPPSPIPLKNEGGKKFLIMFCASLLLHGAVFGFSMLSGQAHENAAAHRKSISTRISAQKAVKTAQNAPKTPIKPKNAPPQIADAPSLAPPPVSAEADESAVVGENEMEGEGEGVLFDGASNAYFDSLLERVQSRIASLLVYPALAKQRNIEGAVGLYFEIEPSGSAGAIRVAESSGSAILDRAALSLIKKIFPLTTVNLKQTKSFTIHIRYALTDR